MVVLLLLFGAGIRCPLAGAEAVARVRAVRAGARVRRRCRRCAVSMQLASEWTERHGGSGGDWVDRAVGEDPQVAVIWREAEPRGPLEAATGVPLAPSTGSSSWPSSSTGASGRSTTSGVCRPIRSVHKGGSGSDGTVVTADGTPSTGRAHARAVLDGRARPPGRKRSDQSGDPRSNRRDCASRAGGEVLRAAAGTWRLRSRSDAPRPVGPSGCWSAASWFGLFAVLPGPDRCELPLYQHDLGVIGFDFRGTLWDPAEAILAGRSPYPPPEAGAIDDGNPAVYPPR